MKNLLFILFISLSFSITGFSQSDDCPTAEQGYQVGRSLASEFNSLGLTGTSVRDFNLAQATFEKYKELGCLDYAFAVKEAFELYMNKPAPVGGLSGNSDPWNMGGNNIVQHVGGKDIP